MTIDWTALTSSANTETIVEALKELKEAQDLMQDKYKDYDERVTVLEIPESE